MPERSGQKWIQVRVDDDFKKVAKMAAAAEDKQMSAYIRGLVAADVEKKGITLPDAPSN